MKKIIISFILLFTVNFTFSQYNVIPKEQIETLKKSYNWNDEKILIVNFYLPKNKCHYNQYENLKNGSQWFDNNIYKTINLSNTKNIFVYSDKLAAKKMIDNNRFFEDFENYFLSNFFNVNDNCYGVIAINSDGRYSYKIGEFSTEDVTLLLKNVN
jgi:hypothetical protein